MPPERDGARWPCPPHAEPATVRLAYAEAAEWFLGLVDSVPGGRWEGSGLGSWTLAELVAHTSRAFTTLAPYLERAPDEVRCGDAVSYMRTALALPGANAAVAERGREERRSMGDDIRAEVRARATEAADLVAATDDGTLIDSPAGGMRFADYLATRAFELSVHGLDVAVALEGTEPEPPPTAGAVTLSVLDGLATGTARAAPVIRSLTGRSAWPEGQTLLATPDDWA